MAKRALLVCRLFGADGVDQTVIASMLGCELPCFVTENGVRLGWPFVKLIVKCHLLVNE